MPKNFRGLREGGRGGGGILSSWNFALAFGLPFHFPTAEIHFGAPILKHTPVRQLAFCLSKVFLLVSLETTPKKDNYPQAKGPSPSPTLGLDLRYLGFDNEKSGIVANLAGRVLGFGECRRGLQCVY